MKTETIKEIGKRMGKQRGKSHNFYHDSKGSSGILKKFLSGLSKKEK
ncbi:hypothetical protein [Sinanaerobacter chloroacetimidivorans]|jgi:hypothetical protein|uniref:Uncharacterized protein n=1 Tax=Sinanaerobacter chloroacetimidivorans TaxID=2818044 RepID=A0A8J7W2Y3_9FIRM|nr:hypothetical protein [Sinanaerobacter chloroacetimidivorans]MBR0598305.1 hypothetical protein [Sinanaerobacter chloroacetimidivorans]